MRAAPGTAGTPPRGTVVKLYDEGGQPVPTGDTGNLGLALADYPGFRQEGFEIAALFDAANEKIGHESRSGVPIYDIRELKKVARRERLDIAVIAVPAPHAQPVVDQVVAAGVKAILNFSPGALKVPEEVKLKSVDLTVSLESLSFYLAQGEAADG